MHVFTEMNITRHTRSSTSMRTELCPDLSMVEGKVTYNLAPLVVTVSDPIFHKCAFQGELVIRFPHSQHSLRDQKFFLALRSMYVNPNSTGLHGTGLQVSQTNLPYVVVHYQQDLLQIDLFIFFSCFFACFFLLLWTAMGVWKLKLLYEQRQRHVRAQEVREQNANRPFAQVRLLLPAPKQDPTSSELPLLQNVLARGGHQSTQANCTLAYQPLNRGKAWLTTSIVQLPGLGSERTFALATALTQPATENSPIPGLRKRGFSSKAAQLQKPWRNRQVRYEIGRGNAAND